jgi:hypothetical protein
LEAAQVLLGHARADVTQVYAERNERLAATVAAKIGYEEPKRPAGVTLPANSLPGQ